MPHANIPIFIPHMGCPNQCVFCNQRAISGRQSLCMDTLVGQIESVLATVKPDTECEIAFFGGSFTGIDQGLMQELLELAQGYVKEGRVSSVRLSTRPDYINDKILSILSRYSVRHIELGLQSMDDSVLAATRRGHTAKQAEDACRAVVQAGFSLVGQMMIGLPDATVQSEIRTAERIVSLGASAARIYPTVVLRNTPLCGMYESGDYQPLSLDDAIVRSAAAYRVFQKSGVQCLRIGLCDGEALFTGGEAVAGPTHPALGELVQNEYYYQELKACLAEKQLLGKDVVLLLPARKISKAVGQSRRNIKRLLRETDTRVQKIVGEEERNGIGVESVTDFERMAGGTNGVSEITGNAGL